MFPYPTPKPKNTTPKLEDVKRLRLEPGDALVIGLPDDTSKSTVDQVRSAFKNAFPQHQVLVLTGKADLTTVSPNATPTTQVEWATAETISKAKQNPLRWH